MCTWFYADYASLSVIIDRAQQLPLADEIMKKLTKKTAMSGDIRPTDPAAVLAPNQQGNMAVFPMLWGFTQETAARPIINCRAETAGQKAMWRESWFRRRCVIPASWYYEWGTAQNAPETRKKEKYAIRPAGAEVTYLAGLYRFEEHKGMRVPMFAVLTRPAVPPVQAIHDRMPLILPGESLEEWLRPDADPGRIAERALTNMVMEKAADVLRQTGEITL